MDGCSTDGSSTGIMKSPIVAVFAAGGSGLLSSVAATGAKSITGAASGSCSGGAAACLGNPSPTCLGSIVGGKRAAAKATKSLLIEKEVASVLLDAANSAGDAVVVEVAVGASDIIGCFVSARDGSGCVVCIASDAGAASAPGRG